MWLLFHCYIFILCAVVSSEVITLTKSEYITCVVTGDSISSGLYVSPPNAIEKLDLERTDDNNIDVKTIDTWKATKSAKDFSIVTDERWTGFNKRKSPKLHDNLGFSICVNENATTIFNILLNHYHVLKEISIPPNKNRTFDNDASCQWNHYILEKENKTIILKNIKDTTINQTDINDTSVWVIFKDIPNENYKIHHYEFFYAKNVSLNKSYISIPSTRCISMYVSIDEKCFLNITLESADNNILKHDQIDGFNEKNSLKTWKKYEIRSESSSDQMRLGLFRGCHDNKVEVGYWAIDDIKICDSEKVVYKSKLNASHSSNYVCQTLDSKNELSEMSCNAPMIGKNCNVNCSSILGRQYSKCEGHKICLEKNCQCAWGYHGINCNETCGKNRWGLNCANECSSECAQCDSYSGCTGVCSKKTFGEDCSKKLPVVLFPPKLVDITDDSIIISVNLEHNASEESPDSYVVQYKALEANEDFKNYSKPSRCGNTRCNTTLTRKNSDSIVYRILLLVNGTSFDEDIPMLTVYKTSLNATNDDDKQEIKVSWMKQNYQDNNYVLKYSCFFSMCPSIEGRNETKETTLIIRESKLVSNCIIELFNKTNETEQLIDKTDVNFATSTEEIREDEMPKNVSLVDKMLQMDLNVCSSFNGPLEYYIRYKCESIWCKNQTSKETNYTLKNYNGTVNVQLKELIPFTTYKIDIVAKRLNQENLNRSYFNIKSQLAERYKLMNLSIYSLEDDTLFVRWKDPMEVKEYKIVLLDRKNEINSTTITEKCFLWDNFTCANIAEYHRTSNNYILVSVRNSSGENWSEPDVLENVEIVTQVPENIQLQFSNFSNSTNFTDVLLTWEHPLFTYGKLDKFIIEIVDDRNRTFNKITSVVNYSKIYSHTITVDFFKNYNISVRGSNKLDGKEAYVFLMVSDSIPEFWGRPFLIWCLKSCYLILPHQEKLTNFIIQQDGKTLVPSCANRTDCNTHNLVYELKENIEKAKGTVFNISLVYKNTNKSIYFNTNKSIYFKRNYTSIIIIILFVILACVFSVFVCLSLGIFCHEYKNDVFLLCKKENELREENSLLESNNHLGGSR